MKPDITMQAIVNDLRTAENERETVAKERIQQFNDEMNARSGNSPESEVKMRHQSGEFKSEENCGDGYRFSGSVPHKRIIRWH